MLFIHFELMDCFHRILHLDGHYELLGYLFLLSFLINMRSVPKVMRMILKKNCLFLFIYSLQNRLLVVEYSDSSIAAILHSSGGSIHLRCCSKPLSQLSGHFQLSQNYVLWGGFWAWGIKRNHTEPSQGCAVGGEVLWYYFKPKIPTHWTNSSGPVSYKFFSCANLL